MNALAIGSRHMAPTAMVESTAKENTRHTNAPTSEPVNTSDTEFSVGVEPKARPQAVSMNAFGIPMRAHDAVASAMLSCAAMRMCARRPADATTAYT